MTTCAEEFGDLKMVKVRRGKKGHRKSRSLVFRISRAAAKPASHDSGTALSTAEELTSCTKKLPEDPSGPVKVQISRLILQDKNKESEINIPSSSTEHFAFQDHNTNTLSVTNTDTSQELPTEEETKYPELRRSSRRILLKLQRDNQSDLSISQPAGSSREFSRAASSANKLPGEKKKRGRKRAVKAAATPDLKKRKYSRRGRPPSKFSLPRNFGILKSGNRSENDKMFLKAPKNSIWTLVPKELFKSEYFKSQVIKIRFTSPTEKNQSVLVSSEPVNFPQSITLPTTQYANNENTHLIFSKPIQATTLYIQEKLPEEKEYKRPTVIYFRNERKNFDHTDNQRRDFGDSQYENEYSKSRSDLAYLYNKYHHVVDNLTLANCYEIAGGNVNEADNMLTASLSDKHLMPPVNGYPSSCVSKASLSGCTVYDFSPRAPLAARSEVGSYSNVDTLSRKIIVESLRILYDEEAVLS